MIDHHSWPEFFFFFFQALFAQLLLKVVCTTAMVTHVLVRLSTSKGRKKPPSPAHKTGSRYHLGVYYFQNVRRAPPSYIRVRKPSAQTFTFAARHTIGSSSARLIY